MSKANYTSYQRNPQHLCIVPITVWDQNGVARPNKMSYQPARQMVFTRKAYVIDGSNIGICANQKETP